jgi:hypothetical protein
LVGERFPYLMDRQCRADGAALVSSVFEHILA